MGDGADGSPRAKRVAARIAEGPRHPFRFLYLGDVYESGTPGEFRSNYESVYGRFKSKTAPTLGNHESANRSRGYDTYWTRVHGQAPSFYNLRASGWQLLGLNSEIDMSEDSPQLTWLEGQLSKSKFGDCRIGFWHRPRYSAGELGDHPDVAPLWEALAGRASVVVNAHDHNMQRLRRREGITAFVSGAGGHEPGALERRDPRLAFGDDTSPGALRLRLGHENLRWWFIDVRGGTLDRGRLTCRRG